MILLAGAVALAGAGVLGISLWRRHPSSPAAPGWTGAVTPIAGGERGYRDGGAREAQFADPYGLVLAPDGTLYVTDAGDTNRVRRISRDGTTVTVAGSSEGYADGPAATARFDTPSGVARDAAGNLYVADTGNNAIRKITPQGMVSTLAGGGEAGFRDGPGRAARFNGPIGVAVDAQGVVYVADTYNDRIRRIGPDGQVTTVAGGDRPGFQDGPGAEARLDTPCALAFGDQGEILVADTGNDAIRRIAPDGTVSTLARTPSPANDALLKQPVALARAANGDLYIGELQRGRLLKLSPAGALSALPAPPGAGGGAAIVRVSHPSALALDRSGDLYVTEAAKFRVDRIGPARPAAAKPASPGGVFALGDVSKAATFPWPLAPQAGWHEVVGVMGEVRGAYEGDSRDHLHAGLDIQANVGQPVLATTDGKVESPVANWGFQGLSEGIRVDLVTYIHMRVGRTADGAPLDPRHFTLLLNDKGRPERVRVKRGTRFQAGDPLGTVNRMAHVHLELGPPDAKINPLRLPFIGLVDHVPPTIRSIQLVDPAGQRLARGPSGRVLIDRRGGDVSIIVDAYDLTDGNQPRRRLGLYKVGYQILEANGVPVKGFETPLVNIEFAQMPTVDGAPKIAYAQASGDTVHGASETRFLYVATNRVRDGIAQPGAWRPRDLPAGDYIVRVFAADYAGNIALQGRDLPVTLE